MSTQHPDNVSSPFFAENAELGGEDEIQEAYYSFSHLGCDEQMWDCEGKEVDSFVVKKLLTTYESFFQQHRIGEDVRLTLRVPNPAVEKTEAKILLETLESIPRSFDAAKLFYNDDKPPIYEVILPMASTADSVNRVYHYYRHFVSGKSGQAISKGDITIAKWIGEFKPESINVIPLFEDKEHLLSAGEVTKAYLSGKDVEYQRVMLARSDPAINYGQVSAVLLNKIALQRLKAVEEKTSVPIYPIIGAGSAPFRGNLRPETVDLILKGYARAHTFTIQSAFKYDHQPKDALDAINKIRSAPKRQPITVDEQACLKVIEKYSAAYRNAVTHLAPLINEVAAFVPARRKRKLHIGLFGYSRELKGISLPRAISFTAALYSLGLPPEILGLQALTARDVDVIVSNNYANFHYDLGCALKYFNEESLSLLPKKLHPAIGLVHGDVEKDLAHLSFSSEILKAIRQKKTSKVPDLVVRAGQRRGFLG